MTLIDIVLFTGAACISPIDEHPQVTVAYKTPCAEVIYLPVANPFKVAQEQNVITVITPKKTSRLCGAKTAVWYVKNNKRRYRCR